MKLIPKIAVTEDYDSHCRTDIYIDIVHIKSLD